MNPLQEFLSIIASYDLSDAWGDCGADEACDVLKTFESTDWQLLRAALLSLPDDQLIRIAYALVDGIPEEACPLLIRLIESKNQNVSITACGALRVILLSLNKKIQVSPNVIARINDLVIVASEPSKSECASLLNYLLT